MTDYTNIAQMAIYYVAKRREALDLRAARRATPCDNYDPETGWGRSCWALSPYESDYCPQCTSREALHRAYGAARYARDQAMRRLERAVNRREQNDD
jgi:hypothetical protein